MIPTEVLSRVPAWQEEYGEVLKGKVGNNHSILFRRPRYGEYKRFLEAIKKQEMVGPSPVSLAAQDYLLEKCILWTDIEDFDALGNTTVENIVRYIANSAYFHQQGFMKVYEGWHQFVRNDADTRVILLICRAFPSITPLEVDSWDVNTLMRHVAMAEEILRFDLFGGPRYQEQPEPEEEFDAAEAMVMGSRQSASFQRTAPKRRAQSAEVRPTPSRTIDEGFDPLKGGTIDIEAENRALRKVAPPNILMDFDDVMKARNG